MFDAMVPELGEDDQQVIDSNAVGLKREMEELVSWCSAVKLWMRTCCQTYDPNI